ncbi:DUF3892 domain-containing protein [Brevibacillus fluminis]|uniref:DUF3892 domain-containing protein n=1 Tax=Brevibacillus fluminis TaxID=511487 RepID=A0A3M8D939_9BACL|nr:DUF3892 domain-containing protein [Brevibacillus fluminis]RNB84468.1 DUF3892 domain-containing protein [Brevibacillus fluminis]
MENEQKPHVVAVRKNGDGDIIQLRLSNGNEVDYLVAQRLAAQGEIENVQLFKGRDGDQHLRSIPDGDKSNNLDNLPLF